MTREALIRELRRLARKEGVRFDVVPGRGKGSHYQVYFDDRTTTIKSGELKPGYVKLIRKQLGIEWFQSADKETKMDYVFRARFVADPDGGYLATFPDVPEAITQGDDMADARASAADALGVALRGRLADGKPLPEPLARDKGLVAIPVDPETALKLAVIVAFTETGITKSEFARRLGKAANEPYRILDPDHPTKLAALKDALAALGKEMIVSVRDAA